jgi:hypothetical protein
MAKNQRRIKSRHSEIDENDEYLTTTGKHLCKLDAELRGQLHDQNS